MSYTGIRAAVGRIELQQGEPQWAVASGRGRVRAEWLRDHEHEDVTIGIRADWQAVAPEPGLDSDAARVQQALVAGKPVPLYCGDLQTRTAYGLRTTHELRELAPGSTITIRPRLALWLLTRYPWLLEEVEPITDKPRGKPRSE